MPLERATVSTGRRSARNLLVAVAVAGLVSLPAAGAWWLQSSSSFTPNQKGPIALAKESDTLPDRLAAAAPSIIVLPFINLSGDAAQDFVADGVTDSLISDLAHAMPGISVVSRDTAFTLKAGAQTRARWTRAGGALPA